MKPGPGQRLLLKAPSRLLHWPGSPPVKGSSLLTDVLLSQWLQALRSDILITTRSELHVAAARFVPSEVRLVAQEHVHYFQRSEPVRRRVEACIDRIDALVVLTERDRHDYIEESPWPPGKISVIANAVQCPLRSPVVERRKVVVAAGRLTPQKGFDRLIDAFVPVARTHPDWQLHIFGKGPDRGSLKKQIKRREMSSHVRLMGWEDHLDQVFSEASILALSSRFEGLPLVVIEAMNQGLPTVAFDCPTGPRELVTHGETGLLVPNGDVVAFSRALTRLITNSPLREIMGQAALIDASRYQLSAVGPQWESLFKAVLSVVRTDPADAPRRRGPRGRASRIGRPALRTRAGGVKV